MGYAIDALPMGVRNVRKNPKLIGISYALVIVMIPLAIVGAIIAVLLSFIPILGPVLARLVVGIPLKILILGGMVGAAGAGFAGSVSFGDYLDSVKDNFTSLFGAFALFEVIIFAITIGVVIVALFVLGFGSLLGSTTSRAPMASAGLGLGVVALYFGTIVLVLTIAMVFQFLDVAVVLGDHGAVDAFKESWRLTREAPLSVFGYSIMRGLLGGIVVLPGWVLVIAGTHVSDVVMYVGFVITLLLYPVAFAVVMSYHAAYYGVRLKAA